MDTYSKSILTIIAILLAIIAFKPSPVTVGDFKQARVINDPEVKKQAFADLYDRLPMVRINGTVGVNGSVEIDRY